MLNKGIVIGCFLLASATRVAADDLTRQVDKLFDKWNKLTTPGCALAIVHNGKIIYEHAYGMATLKPAAPISTRMVFPAGSVSKQFAAAVIAILASRGQLSLDDDIHSYFKELPDYGAPITIRHLIHHTSGLKDYASLTRLRGPRELPASDDDMLRLVARQKTLNYAPGAEYMYSNTNYALLALLVKRVTGKPFQQFADEVLFKPLGMTETYFYRHDQRRTGEPRVVGYTEGPTGGFVEADNVIDGVFDQAGDGGLRTTVRDMVAWDQNYETPKAWDDKLNKLLLTSGKLRDGTFPPDDDLGHEGYAFGLELGTYKSVKWVGHSGGSSGFHSIIYRVPSERFSVIILANADVMWMWPLARRISDIYLRDRFTATLAEYAGTYESSEAETRYELAVENGDLIVKRAKAPNELIRSIRTDRFHGSSFGTVQFTRDRGGKLTGFVLDADSVAMRNVRFDRK